MQIPKWLPRTAFVPSEKIALNIVYVFLVDNNSSLSSFYKRSMITFETIVEIFFLYRWSIIKIYYHFIDNLQLIWIIKATCTAIQSDKWLWFFN